MQRYRFLVLLAFLLGILVGPFLLPEQGKGRVLASEVRATGGPGDAESTLRSLSSVGAGAEADLTQDSRMKPDKSRLNASSKRMTPIVRAVQLSGPSVVNIQVGRQGRTRSGELVFQKIGEGSGVIVDEDGLLITNWHVVRIKDRVAGFACFVSLRDGRRFPAKVLSTSRENDLALLSLTPKDGKAHKFPPITIGDSDQLMVGETVIAIGNPRGQANTVTAGVLSAKGRSLSVTPPGETRPIQFASLLQTDAAINPGNSGGALLDVTGKLIGINTLMQQASENIGFAIPVNRMKKVFQTNLLRYDRVEDFWTGFRVDPKKDGVYVSTVTPDGPAERAGFRPGDRIQRIGSRTIKSLTDYGKALILFSPEERIAIAVDRGTKKKELTIVPWSRARYLSFGLAGIVVEELDDTRNAELIREARRALFGRNERRSPRISVLRVKALQKGGPAEQLGVRVGDCVLGYKYLDHWLDAYRRVPLTNGESEWVDLLNNARGNTLQVLIYRRGEALKSGPLDVR